MSHPKSRIMTFLIVLGVALTSACASSGGGGGGPAGDDTGQGTIEMQVWNRSDQAVVVFARWGNAPRVRLGNLSAGRRGTYMAYVQGPLVGISWDVMSGRAPAGTAAAGAAFPDVADGPGSPQCGIDVRPGDRIEWTIAINSRSCSYVRLDPAGFN